MYYRDIVDVCISPGRVIRTSQSSWLTWDSGQIMPSWRAITCRCEAAFALQYWFCAF